MTETPHTPVLQIRDLSISFAQPRPAVNAIDVHVDAGEVVALVGESGSGKSMTARAVLGLLPDGARATGSVRVGDVEVIGADEATLGRLRGARVGMVFQEPQTALNPVRTIGWQLREALRVHSVHAARGGPRWSRKGLRDRAVELLREVEIPDPESRLGLYPHQFSGGQKQRIVLALALAGEPELLLADEPTTALDVTVQAEILALLDRIRQRTGTGVLLITHNMGVVAQLADRVVVLRHGDVVETGRTTEIFAGPREAYTRQLLGSVLRLPRVSAVEEAPRPVPELPKQPEDPTGRYALAIDGLVVRYGARARGRDCPAVKDVDLRLRHGHVLGLVGESGSGKTTIGRVAAGLVPIAAGRVVVDDVPLPGSDTSCAGGADSTAKAASKGRLRALRRELAFVHQDPAAALDPRMSVGEAIREPLDIHDVGTRAERAAQVAELLRAVRLPASYADRRPRELSGGQRQRVALARALVMRPKLLIADEPTSALDVSVQADVLRLFRRLQTELGFACVFISHDLAVVHEVADEVAVLKSGELLEHGPVAEVFGTPRHDYTRRLLEAVPSPEPVAAAGSTARAAAS